MVFDPSYINIKLFMKKYLVTLYKKSEIYMLIITNFKFTIQKFIIEAYAIKNGIFLKKLNYIL